ncbi:glycosyltransferase, putative, partial [Bodo saltans]
MLQMNVHCSFLRKRNRIVVIKERESHMPHIAAAFLLLLCFCLVCVSPPCNASSLSAPSPHRGVPHDDDEDTMVKLVAQITNNFQNDEDNPDDHRNLPTETRSSNYLKSAAPIIVTNRGTEDQTDDANANSDVNVGDAAPVVVAAPLAPRDGAVFHNPQHDEYQVMLFYYRAQRPPSPNMPNITLVAHATIDRLHAVARWCRTLRGPMSISVFVRPFVDDIATVMGAFVADECIARHADLHLVTERGHRYEPREDGGKDMMTHYPFNVQRNAALDGCVGDLALLMDIDFHLMPVPNNREVDLRRNLVEQQAKMASWSFLGSEPWVRDAAVYVIPAVETMNKRVKVPRTMSELRTGLDDHSVLAFYHTCQTCHRPTDLRRFSRPTTTEAYLIQFEEGYEPYVILNRSSTTPMA